MHGKKCETERTVQRRLSLSMHMYTKSARQRELHTTHVWARCRRQERRCERESRGRSLHSTFHVSAYFDFLLSITGCYAHYLICALCPECIVAWQATTPSQFLCANHLHMAADYLRCFRNDSTLRQRPYLSYAHCYSIQVKYTCKYAVGAYPSCCNTTEK